MPLLSMNSNIELDQKAAENIIQSASKLIAQMLGKPERYVMIKLETNTNMLFAGTRQALIYAELKSIGLDNDKTSEYSARLTDFFVKEMQIPADRVYIEFANAEAHMWGWNGATF